jgi:hypothetical protein
MSTTIERVRLFAAVVLVAIGGVLSTAALAGDEHEATKRCQGRCHDRPKPTQCGPTKWCCCVDPEDPKKYNCLCMEPIECVTAPPSQQCQW